MMTPADIDIRQLSGRNRRLYHEWQELLNYLGRHAELQATVTRQNEACMPIGYRIEYAIRSIASVTNIDQLDDPAIEHVPVFADRFILDITIPSGYPCIDAQPEFRFLTQDAEGKAIPHPWHPNIRYFGHFAGRVCINLADSYTSIAWAVQRIAQYLRYERYHAIYEPPYPEDLKVAAWVTREAEPKDWLFFAEN